MALRPRQHIVEDESRVFFRQNIPSHWVVRDKPNDYGIDCEVEIFDQSGKSTSLVFWVQLKATDSKSEKVIKKLSLKKEKIKQFSSYQLPVLIVRYSSHHKNQYAKWSRAIPLSGRQNENSYTVQFYESEKWTNKTPEEINCYLSQQSLVKCGKVSFPVKTFIGRSYHDEASEIPFNYVYMVKQCFGGQEHYYELVANIEDSLAQIFVSKNQVIVSICDQAICTTGTNFEELEIKHFEIFTKYLNVAFCNALFIVGKTDLAHQMFLDENLLVVIRRHKDYLTDLLPFLIAGPHAKNILDEIGNMLEDDSDGTIAMTVQLCLMAERRKSGHSKDSLIEDFFLKHLNAVKTRNHRPSIASALYNLGNFYRNTLRSSEALLYYLETRRYDPSYKKRAYYFFEMAGILFELQRFLLSAKLYEKSLTYPEANPVAMALSAHGLIYAGLYNKGVRKLDEFLSTYASNDDVYKHEWYVWYSCLSTLIEHDSVPIDGREPNVADALVKQGLYSDALEKDLLNGLAWFNRGVMSANEGQMEDAFISFTFAGLIGKFDIEAWGNSILIGLRLVVSGSFEKLSILTSIISTAYFYNKYQFINQVIETARSRNEPLADFLTQLIDTVVQEMPKEPVIIRVHDLPDSATA